MSVLVPLPEVAALLLATGIALLALPLGLPEGIALLALPLGLPRGLAGDLEVSLSLSDIGDLEISLSLSDIGSGLMLRRTATDIGPKGMRKMPTDTNTCIADAAAGCCCLLLLLAALVLAAC